MASLAIDTLWYSDKNYRIIGKVTDAGLRAEFFDTGDSGIRDIAWDGTYIWSISFDGTVKKFSPSGDVIDSYPELLEEGWGLTFDGMYIWASDPTTDQIYQISFPGMGDFTPPAAPALSSDTHPSESVWFSNDSPTFDWTAPTDPSGISGYSYGLDHIAVTVPDTLSEGTTTSATFVGLDDGTWYFHCRARDGAGNWGPPDHYRVKIDTEAPAAPTNVTTIPDGWANINLFQVTWSEPHDISSIIGSYYKIGTPPLHETDGTFIHASLLITSVPDEGEYNLYLWSEDGAGNSDHNAHSIAVLHYDETGPSNGTISINDGAEITPSFIVTLDNLGAIDQLSGMGLGAQMRFSNDGTSWSPAEIYAKSISNWDLTSYGGTSDPGQKTVSVQYQDAAGNWSVSFSDSILLASEPLIITTNSLPGGAVGLAYQETLAATGGVPPYTWSLFSGTLPHNLTLHPDGIINGIPAEPGTTYFVVKVNDSFSAMEFKTFSITAYAGSTKGDVDGDTDLDLFDALLVVQHILGRTHLTFSQLWAANVVDDGAINIADVVAIAHLIVGRTPGSTRISLTSVILSTRYSTTRLDGATVVRFAMENDVPVSGLQLKFLMPFDTELLQPPRLSQHYPSFQLDYVESDSNLILLIYSLTSEVILEGRDFIFDVEISSNTLWGDGNFIIEDALVVSRNGQLLPVEIRTGLESVESGSLPPAHNHPNPFNPETSITFSTPRKDFISIAIYDILGQKVKTIAEEKLEQGTHTVRWNGRDDNGTLLPSGFYYCTIEGRNIFQTVKLTLIR